ncbi:hypothetical protein L1887_02553 [Cichorium endivia]|nr:hypothetical protein L1887_02553 [Cichorium endivia]
MVRGEEGEATVMVDSLVVALVAAMLLRYPLIFVLPLQQPQIKVTPATSSETSLSSSCADVVAASPQVPRLHHHPLDCNAVLAGLDDQASLYLL